MFFGINRLLHIFFAKNINIYSVMDNGENIHIHACLSAIMVDSKVSLYSKFRNVFSAKKTLEESKNILIKENVVVSKQSLLSIIKYGFTDVVVYRRVT